MACIFLLAATGLVYGSLRYMSETLESPSSIAIAILNFAIAAIHWHCAFEVAKLGPLGSYCFWCLFVPALPSTGSA